MIKVNLIKLEDAKLYVSTVNFASSKDGDSEPDMSDTSDTEDQSDISGESSAIADVDDL